MATEYDRPQTVFAGAKEYSADMTPSAQYDKINMRFDGELVVDDIVVTLGGSASLNFKLKLIYSTGTTMEITPNAQSSSYSLNQNNDSRNLWYRLPKWTTLQLEITSLTTADNVKLSVIGRG